MALNVRNIIVGAAQCFVATTTGVQTSLPTFTAGVSAVTSLEQSGTFRNIGLTTNNIEVAFNPTYTDVTVDQLKDAALIFAEALTIMVNTSLVEASLQNLQLSWGAQASALTLGGSPDTSGNQDTFNMAAGAIGDYPTERSMAFVGNAPRTANPTTRRERVYFARRVVQVSASANSLMRGGATVYPVSLRMLPDASGSYNGAEYGTIVDRTL